MTHNWKVNNIKFCASVTCTHPDLRDNTCPTRFGKCAECTYCKISIEAPKFFSVLDSLRALQLLEEDEKV